MSHFKLNDINSRIVAANNPSLVNIKETPIKNIIYHLYNNGQITSQKGGWAYSCLGETTNYKFRIINNAKMYFRFPNIMPDGTSYAVLTENQCIEFYKEMNDCLILLNNSYPRI
jgi:hypothetical protein